MPMLTVWSGGSAAAPPTAPNPTGNWYRWRYGFASLFVLAAAAAGAGVFLWLT